MSKEDADNEIKKGNFVKEEPGNGYRRIIAAPKPKRSARMRTDSDRTLSAEADPNPARKTRERVLTDYNMDINPEREGRICLQIVPES